MKLAYSHMIFSALAASAACAVSAKPTSLRGGRKLTSTASIVIDPDLETCDGKAPPPSGLTYVSEWGNDSAATTFIAGIYAFTWYPYEEGRAPDGGEEANVQRIMEDLLEARCRALLENDMQDLRNVLDHGTYRNVYIHQGESDPFPTWWGNGLGTDKYDNAYLTLTPNSGHHNNNHEGFHLFQYSATNRGPPYNDIDANWFIELAAQYFASIGVSEDDMDAFQEAASIPANPHLALWHGYDNQAPEDPKDDWYYLVRQYSMDTFLYYLSEVRGVPRSVITSHFYHDSKQRLPQEYLYDEISNLRDLFGDWAAANTDDMNYLPRKLVENAHKEAEENGDESNTARQVAEYWDSGTDGFVSPPFETLPRGWAYNVIRVSNTAGTSSAYTFDLDGDSTGTEGAQAVFVARIFVVGENNRVLTVPMTNDSQGSITVDVGPTDERLDIIVAAVPEYFRSNQKYGYQYQITRT